MFKLVFKGEASSSSWSPDNLFAEEHASLGVDDCSISDLEIGGEDCCNVDDTERESDDNSDKGEARDNNSDDDIYEAACSALSAGNADLGLSLLHEALEKYPMDDGNAPEKVQRLFVAALQIVEKNSAALSLLPSTI
ncbi:hypothetical protein KP509_08G071100 [Ceratopteris richardii]|nr:hypothetical protein KP509_08G071100 [Ceratopteris richardii]